MAVAVVVVAALAVVSCDPVVDRQCSDSSSPVRTCESVAAD